MNFFKVKDFFWFFMVASYLCVRVHVRVHARACDHARVCVMLGVCNYVQIMEGSGRHEEAFDGIKHSITQLNPAHTYTHRHRHIQTHTHMHNSDTHMRAHTHKLRFEHLTDMRT